MAIVEETQFFVYVDGKDVSNRWASQLISLTVSDNSGEVSDTCRVCLSDVGGKIKMPTQGAPVKIALGPMNGKAQVIFDGLVDDVSSEGSRGGGMLVWIDGKSIDTAGISKKKERDYWDDKPLGEALQEAAKKAGIELTVDDKIGKLKKKYIAQDNESALHFIQRQARQNGGTFKMIGGKKGVVLDRNSGKSAGASGSAGGGDQKVTATVGENVISWALSPLITRPRFKEITARWYDKKKAKYEEKRATVPDASSQSSQVSKVDDNVRNTRDDEDDADAAAKAGAKESDRDKGSGNIQIDGNNAARAEGKITIKGCRPGIDGEYLINSVRHDLDKNSGWVTTVNVAKPDVSEDDRKEDKETPPADPNAGGTKDLPKT